MRKLKLQMSISVDGFVARTNGEQDWMEWNQDDEFKKLYQNDIIDSVDTILMGRKMTGEFISFWGNVVNNQPNSPWFPFAQKLVNIPKIVFSKTIKTIAGKNTRVENDELVTVVNNLKSESGKDILVYGGATIQTHLLFVGLVKFILVIS